MLEFIGHFHPLILHLPIGILTIGVLLVFWYKRNPTENSEKTISFIFKVAFVTAVISCITGYLLKDSGGYGEELVDRHQWSAIVLTVLIGIYAFFAIAQKYQLAYLVLTMLVLTFTGHQGGSLTHGEDFLSFSSKPTRPVIENVEEALVYDDIVKPIMEEKCYQCHASQKQKGDLRLDSPEAILAGGEDGKVLIYGNIDESPLYSRLILPQSNEEHMPPKGKPQPTEDEIKLIKWWIAQGGDFDKKVSQIENRDEVAEALVRLESPPEAEVDAIPLIPSKEVAAVNLDLIKELEKAGAAVVPVSQNSNYLSVNFLANPKITCQVIPILEKVKENITWLDIKEAQIDDKCIETLGSFENLISLDLSGTAITDEGLKSLASLKKLQRLYLVNSQVSSEGLMALADLQELQRLYLYKSQVEVSQLSQLQTTFPHVEIDLGGYQLPLLATDTVLVNAN